MASAWNSSGNSTDGEEPDPGKLFTSTRDLGPQAVISVALGLTAFLTFCVSGGPTNELETGHR